MINTITDRQLTAGKTDEQIDKDDTIVDENLKAMRDFYGEEQLAKMTPDEFYRNYKKFVSGLVF